jgi:protein-S-isoprenylcysteine O-methyltransferase Ste14
MRMPEGRDMKVNVVSLWAQVAGMFVVFALGLFLPAGTLDWWPGWVFLGMFSAFTVSISIWLLKHDPGLMQERLNGFKQERRASWDNLILILAAVLWFTWLIVMPIDAVRFHWSHIPLWLQVVGAALLLCSFYIFFLTYRENPYLSGAVRIQEDRGQKVISTGAYAIVRHPMYAGVLILVVGTDLLLGSWYGLIPGLTLVMVVAWRAVLEENLLRQELSGYTGYMARVKYRMIPHVW